ncbi:MULTISPECIES: HD domain-containing protein [unclassified Haladaptatus]|uniref:HD domain-containing protein n=1 Tax=unclassified Haladaptatus TaxID=2622732 RepID=UPI00209C5C0E|nr:MULTISPECIES: HD domain-containing protein [unclassified Haladaptatus]MCO8242742.1 HD domain-containing protein [Haladaptatus sp. AB643]MCO8252501.1 HD domain-containing protein [Haladaptatus sp. AB618]
MQAIKDSVHDYVELPAVAAALLDTAPVQRLRHIKQLSTVRLVYPSANHTRFEHSIGVTHLAGQAVDRLGIDDRRATAVQAAALLHDVGHGPYGHQTEGIIERRLDRHHDEVGDLLDHGELAAVLERYDLNPKEIAALVAGEGELGQLVAGELDVDRMDYLVRDAHHTGVPYGTVDYGRLLSALRFADGNLVLADGNVQTAESLLVARALMNATVYRHHVSRIAGAMLERTSERLLDSTEISSERFQRFTDAELLAALRNCEETAAIANRIAERNLFKRAVWAEWGAVPDDVVTASHESVRKFERDIAAKAGVEPEHVLLDTLGEPSMPESSSRVVVNGEIRRLADQSPLVQGLQESQRTQWRLGVYAPEAATDDVERAAKSVLGLDS